MDAARLILLLLAVSAVVSVVTVVLHYIFKKRVLIKYVPGFLFLIIGIYFFYQSRQPSEGFQDIASLLMAFMAMAGFGGGVITGVFIDAILPIIRNTKEM